MTIIKVATVKNAGYYFTKGFDDVHKREIVAFSGVASWQQAAYQRGYKSGMIYFEAEALREGFDSASEYRQHLLKQTIKV